MKLRTEEQHSIKSGKHGGAVCTKCGKAYPDLTTKCSKVDVPQESVKA